MTPLFPEQKLALAVATTLALGSALGSQTVLLLVLGAGGLWYHQGSIPGLKQLLEFINREPPPPSSLAGQIANVLFQRGE